MEVPDKLSSCVDFYASFFCAWRNHGLGYLVLNYVITYHDLWYIDGGANFHFLFWTITT